MAVTANMPAINSMYFHTLNALPQSQETVVCPLFTGGVGSIKKRGLSPVIQGARSSVSPWEARSAAKAGVL